MHGALAGGFDRGSSSIELLFDPARIATESGVTYVSPQRTIKNVQRARSETDTLANRVRGGLIQAGAPAPVATAVTNGLRQPALSSESVDIGGDYAVPRLGAKFNLWEPVDCLASYTRPYGADADYGRNNAYSITATRFEVDTDEYSLTCSYKFALENGHQVRVIGGGSYQEIDAFLSRQTLLDFGNEGEGKFELSDGAWSYRLGGAYEIPEIAFRASLVYTGSYDYDLTGTVDTTGFGANGAPISGAVGARLAAIAAGLGLPAGALRAPLTTGVYAVDAQTEIPQAVEFRLQTGIAADTLAFASVRWQDWSQLQSVPINGVISPTSGEVNPDVSFDAFYEDGWTISAGVGRKFTEQLSGLASVTWDKGTSTFLGTQSDTYNFAVGGSFIPKENVEFRLGGSLGVLTGGRSDFEPNGDPANDITYEYDADLVAAVSGSFRLKF
ncbi:MAG: long-chain fatty acid transporter [Mesorhizobium amorphae]|nr:MAG: long-chain fatty acid transporter [Mesorhizobium amorphae]